MSLCLPQQEGSQICAPEVLVPAGVQLEWKLLGISAVRDAAETKPDAAIVADVAWQSMHAGPAAPVAVRSCSDS